MESSFVPESDKPFYFPELADGYYHGATFEKGSDKLTSCPTPSTFGYLLDSRDGSTKELGCNRWTCPYCSIKLRGRLFFASQRYFKKFKYIRMWTFTLQHTEEDSEYSHYLKLKEVWRRFVTEIRRSKYLRQDQRKFEFFKCLDLHESGFIHFHVLVNVFLPYKWCQDTWEHIAQELLGTKNHVGACNVIAIPSAKIASSYVVSYVQKVALSFYKGIRRWSKSNKLRLFDYSKSTSTWHFMLHGIPESIQFEKRYGSPLSLLVEDVPTSQQYRTSKDLKPPENNFFPVNSS